MYNFFFRVKFDLSFTNILNCFIFVVDKDEYLKYNIKYMWQIQIILKENIKLSARARNLVITQ